MALMPQEHSPLPPSTYLTTVFCSWRALHRKNVKKKKTYSLPIHDIPLESDGRPRTVLGLIILL